MKIPFFSKEKTVTPQVKTVVKKEIKLFTTIDSEGFYCHHPKQILQSSEFKPLVDKISNALGGRRDVFEKYLYPSIEQVALFSQKLPAAESIDGKPSNVFGHHMSEGGLLLHSLETMYFALNDSRLAFFNKGVNPSDRDAHMTAARVACGLAGLLHDIGKLNDPIVVTYKDKREYVWNCVESLPDFLARVHGLPLEDVYVNEDDNEDKIRKAPTYVLKGWKKGRTDKHEIIAPFLMRSFVSKATLKMMSAASEQIIHDFMTAVDWRVLSSDYTDARQNIIYDVWSRADVTSSERDRKTLSKASLSLSPIKSNLEIKKQITTAFQFFIDRADIAVNKDSEECYIYTHATEVSENPFVVLVRFDEKALGMWSTVLAKASELFRSDVLQDHAPTLDNIRELLTQADYLLKATTADGLYTVKRTVGEQQIEFKAVCFADYRNIIKHNGQLYLAQKDDLSELKVTFADGVKPVILSKGNNSKKDLRTDLIEKKKDTDAKSETADVIAEKTAEIKTKTEDTPAEKSVKIVAKSGVSEAELNADGDISLDADVTEVNLKPDNNSDSDSDTPEIVPVIVPLTSEETTVSQENGNAASAPSEFSASFEESVTASFLQNIFNTSVQNQNLNPDDLPSPVEEEPDDRPLVLKENQIRNFDRAVYGFKDNQKSVVNARKPYAVRLKELNTEDTADDEEIFNSETEKHFNGLKVKVVKAIKHVSEQIKDKDTRKLFSIQICKRLKDMGFSYIDFVTVDNKFCYAAFGWGDDVKKNAHATQYMKAFEKAGLFPNSGSNPTANSGELFYFQCVQMTKAVTNIFKLAGTRPLKIKCKDHPYESLLSENDIIEYIKHKIITLDKDESFFGCKATGYAHDKKGKRISRVVLGECANSYNVSMNHVRKLLSINQQVTPPYMIADGNELVVAYSKPLKKEEYREDDTEKKQSEEKSEEKKVVKNTENKQKKRKTVDMDVPDTSLFTPLI